MNDEHNGTVPASGGSSASPRAGGGARGQGRGQGRELMEAIAADLRAMRTRLDTAHDLAHQNSGLLAEALPQLELLGQGLATLTGRVNALTGTHSNGGDGGAGVGGDGADDGDEPDTGPYADARLTVHGLLPAPGHQLDWHLMSAEQALPAWEALAAWVATVVCGRLAFTRAQLPDCWALHPQAVAELSWAHQLHRALAGPGVGPVAVAEWHTRWLPHLHNRLTAAIDLDVDDPLSPEVTRAGSDTRPRCRLGHYHQLSPKERRTAELGLDRQIAEPERRGHGQRDDSRLTGHTLSRTNLPVGDLDALDATRRAIAERRHHAQRKLDYAVPVHRRYQGEDRVPDATRPRYLTVQPGDAHPHATPAVEQPAHPALWLPLYREAAHHDLAARRHRDQRRDQHLDQRHPNGPRFDVTLDRAVLEPHPHDRDDARDDDGAGRA